VKAPSFKAIFDCRREKGFGDELELKTEPAVFFEKKWQSLESATKSIKNLLFYAAKRFPSYSKSKVPKLVQKKIKVFGRLKLIM
jgi:hypothetical protein